MSRTVRPQVTRSPIRLEPDRARVVTRIFVPGQEGFDHQESRSSLVLERILALTDVEVKHSYEGLVNRFENRHRDLIGTFARHADELADRIDPDVAMSKNRRLLLGATFTCEYAIEGAALCNPSVVPDPDQSGVANGSLRFVMSTRAIGEGHRSSIGFRSGTVDKRGHVKIEPTGPYTTAGASEPATYDAALFREELQRFRGNGDSADYVFDALGDRFTWEALEKQLARLQRNLATRAHGSRTVGLIRSIAERTYAVRFPEGTALSERILTPAMGAESHGMEDARFVRFVDDDGTVTYYATYTAYDGTDINQQMLETDDFVSFTSSPLVGQAASNKGLALFPRRINGSYVALTRSDRESNSIVISKDPRHWLKALPCQVPTRPWEVLQLGNCGSPIETEAGWLVLTHGVGPMRTYSIGAVLLDLEDPTKILGQLDEPLLTPAPDEQDGYVPNVVYSCGGLVHGDHLVVPYGIGDAAIGVATVPMGELLAALGAVKP